MFIVNILLYCDYLVVSSTKLCLLSVEVYHTLLCSQLLVQQLHNKYRTRIAKVKVIVFEGFSLCHDQIGYYCTKHTFK